MKNIFRIGDSGLIDEFYFIGFTKDPHHAIFANKSGHLPIRVHIIPSRAIVTIGQGWFKTHKLAAQRAIYRAERILNLLQRK